MEKDKNNVPARRRWLRALLFVVPALVLAGKSSGLPVSDFLWRWFSFAGWPAAATQRLQYVLFVPVGAAVVVFFRQTLGVRLLGPFRSILIAVAFQITGILPGLLLLAVVTGIIVAIRPLLKTLRLPYFARISVMLSAVSLTMILVMLGGEWLGLKRVERAAYFPLVVICLTAEGFARTVRKEGGRSAVWRGGMTALVAVFIALLAEIPPGQVWLTQYPELLLTQVGFIILVAEFGDWRLLEKFNPARKKRKRTRTKPSARPPVEAATAQDAAAEQIQTL